MNQAVDVNLVGVKVLMMAGGTGGHVFPALAVANTLMQQELSIYWLGNPEGIEAKIASREGIPFWGYQLQGFRGKSVLNRLAALWFMAITVCRLFFRLKRENIAAVVSMGGYVALAGMLAARLRGIPIIIHEQNTVPGLTNKIGFRLANDILLGFATSQAPEKALVVGNPLRENVKSKQLEDFSKSGGLKLLIVGGSLGASAINQAVVELLTLDNKLHGLQTWHQTGVADYDSIKAQYAQHKLNECNHQVMPFIDDMNAAYQWADMIVARSGAMTVSEIAKVGLPAVLIPYPHAVDDHQTANAQVLVKAGAAVLMPQHECQAKALLSVLQNTFYEYDNLLRMHQAAKSVAKSDAASAVANVVISNLKSSELS